jgi:hypothetical protein
MGCGVVSTFLPRDAMVLSSFIARKPNLSCQKSTRDYYRLFGALKKGGGTFHSPHYYLLPFYQHNCSTIMAEHIVARFAAGPPAIDHLGKPIPHHSRWGYSSDVFLNVNLYSAMFMSSVIAAFIAFNSSQLAYDTYDYLNQHYTPFQINAYGTFVISTVLYYAIAGLFAIVDLTGRPRFLFKYKVQPFQRVSASEYWEITLIVIRNQIFVVLPLVLVKAYFTPNKTSSKDLQGPFTSLAHIIFNILCTEVGFYFIHRAFHSKLLYTRFHKLHHRVTAPVAM